MLSKGRSFKFKTKHIFQLGCSSITMLWGSKSPWDTMGLTLLKYVKDCAVCLLFNEIGRIRLVMVLRLVAHPIKEEHKIYAQKLISFFMGFITEILFITENNWKKVVKHTLVISLSSHRRLKQFNKKCYN